MLFWLVSLVLASSTAFSSQNTDSLTGPALASWADFQYVACDCMLGSGVDPLLTQFITVLMDTLRSRGNWEPRIWVKSAGHLYIPSEVLYGNSRPLRMLLVWTTYEDRK